MWARINFKVLVQLLLPTFLRKPQQTAFLNALVAPMDSLYKDVLYKMQHDSRVIYLEKVLNEYYNIIGYSHQNHEATKQIFITDEFYPPENYVYQDPEQYASIEYDETLLYLKSGFEPDDPAQENNGDDIFLTDDIEHFDFVINVPIALAIDLILLKILVDFYKIAGKKYRIQMIPFLEPAPPGPINNV